MPFELLVLDLDGVVLDSTMGIDPTLEAGLRQAMARGLRVTLATGRMPRATRRYWERLGISMPVILYNGALVRDPVDGAALFARSLPRGLSWQIYPLYANAPVDPLFYEDDVLYCLEKTSPILSYCVEEALLPTGASKGEALRFLAGYREHGGGNRRQDPPRGSKTRRLGVKTRAGLVALLILGFSVGPVTGGPAFDPRAAWSHLEQLVAFGPRPAGSSALARARAYIVGKLKKVGVSVREQAFAAHTPDGPIRMVNVIGELPGRRREVILLGGHYDTKYFSDFRFVGANDGGSSAAVLLELARSLTQVPREFTYWVVFFDGEEARREWSARDGIYGSRHMVSELRRTGELRRLRAVVIVDMIGDKSLNIRREPASTPWLTDLIWGSARRLAYGAHFLDEALAVEDDHTPFLRAGVPATLLIDFDYGSYWHTPEDTLDKLSPRSLGIVGEVLLEALPALQAWLARGETAGAPR